MRKATRNHRLSESRASRICGYICLLLAPQLGESQDAGGTLTLSPATLQFGSQAVGSVSKIQTATLTNKTTTTVTNVAIAITGDFAQTNTCTTSLAPNASCFINVSFSPTVSGMRSGALTVTSSTGNPLTSALSGIGYSLISISLNPSNPTIAAKTIVALQATGSYDDGSTRNISSSVQWTSSAPTIATVDTSGTVTGVAPGPATITATSGSISGSTKVTVSSATLTSIYITVQHATLAQGITEQLTATGKFSDGTSQNISNSVNWSSSAPTVMSVSTSGLIFALAQGSSTIKATLGSVSGSKKITVTSVSLTSITVVLPPPPFAAGTKQQVQATGKFSDGSKQTLTSSVSWTSASPNVVTMDNLGRATALKAGSTTITAALGPKSGSATLAVKQLTVASIAVQASNTSIPAGITQAFTATGTFTDSSAENFTLSVHWTSSAPTIATVSNAAGKEGIAQGLTPGTANIGAVFSSSVSGSATLTVTPAVLVSIAITPANSTIPLGVTEQLEATGTYTDHSTQDVTAFVTWSSSASTVAPVSVGLAEADSIGTTTITASSTLSSGSTITGSTGLTVGAAQLTAIVVAPANDFLQVNATQQYTASGVYTDARTQDLTKTATWSSSAATVASISNASGTQGLATALKAGSTTITAAGPASVTGSTNLTVTSFPPPTITSFTPHSGAIGTPITVRGSNLQPSSGTAAEVTLASQSGGTITAPASSTTATKLTFVIPAGAATGPFTVMENGGSATSATPLTVTAGTTFTMTAAPSSASLIQGQSVAYAITLSSSNGFTQLAGLNVSGVPGGVTATLNPTQITAGQTSILTLVAPASQPIGSAMLSVTASATVNGISVMGSANLNLAVQAPTTSFIGRTVVSNTKETPIAGVTVSMTGMDGNGNTTNCAGSTVSDAAGNFALVNLSGMCVGPQLVGFNGTTATAPPGQYAGVNLVFTLVAGQVTASPVLVHLPQINNVETFNVQQNASTDQTYSYTSIPGLSVTVYVGTTLTLQDGTKPNPFPLAAVQVPVDRLPDAKPNVPTMLRAFIVAFQPANASASQPVAVTFPNTLNTAAGTTGIPLMTLSPIFGQMVPYGTGTVSGDGTQIVPDLDPAHPGHRFGLVHFDWHGAMPSPPQEPPNSPPNSCPPQAVCGPVDLAAGKDTLHVTDIQVNGPRGSISINRYYRGLTAQAGPFGIGTNHNYSYALDTVSPQLASIINLIMPDGNRIPFNLQSAGLFVNSTIPYFLGATMTIQGDGSVDLRYKDGTIYRFVPSGFQLGSLLASITDSNRNAVTLTRNPSNLIQITQIADPVGRSLTLAYDSSNRITSVTDPIGRTVQYTYNSQGTLATVTDPARGLTQYAYDSQNNLTSVTDAGGILTEQNVYDPVSGRLIHQTQADGGVYQFSYTFMNNTAPTLSPILSTLVVDPLQNQTTYRFNSVGFMTDGTDASGQTRSFVRAPGTNVTQAIQGSGECSICGSAAAGDQSFTYDANGNVLTQTDALGNTTTYTYEPVYNKVTSTTDPLGDVTTFTYDSFGNMLTRKDPNGNVTSYTYNSFGQVTQITDPTNQKMTFAYDSFGNLTTFTDALENTTTTTYDAISRPIQTIDALGRRRETAYDALSRITSQTNAQNNKTSFTYDPVSNLLSLTDARNNTTSFTYNGLNRLLTRTTPLGTSDSRLYDFNSSLTSFTDRRGQTGTYAYDSLNRLVTETYSDSTVNRSYDANGRLLQANDSAAGLFTFSYDLDGRLTESTTPDGQVQYLYDNASRVTSRQVTGQAPVGYTYDAATNLLTASSPAASITWTYDPRNLMVTASRANTVNSQYTYDGDQRLLSLNHTGPAGALASQAYGYDAVGNRTSSMTNVAQTLVTQAVAAASYDVNSQQNQFGSTTNSFDANGNLLSATSTTGSTTYMWDSRNRLAVISASTGQTTKFTYDFAGHLIQQLDSGPSLQLTQSIVLDDLTNVAFVSRSDGDQYSVLVGRSIDQHISVVHASGQIEYGLPDAINSTVLTTDQTGAIKSRLFYEPYGQTTSPSTYPFQFTGREPVTSGAYYYRARVYSTIASRFVSEDPIGGSAGINLYTYAGNRPTIATDPTGNTSVIVGVVVIGAAAVAIGGFALCFSKCLSGYEHFNNLEDPNYYNLYVRRYSLCAQGCVPAALACKVGGYEETAVAGGEIGGEGLGELKPR